MPRVTHSPSNTDGNRLKDYNSWLIQPGSGADFQFGLYRTSHWSTIVCLSVCAYCRVSQPLACALVFFPPRWNGRWFWRSVARVRTHHCHRSSASTHQKTEALYSSLHLWGFLLSHSLRLSLFCRSLLRQQASAWFLLKLGNHLSSQKKTNKNKTKHWQRFNAPPVLP